jgi:hypothetical protein
MSAFPPFDVNTARTQRQQKQGATWDFTIDGERFHLPVELPRATAAALRGLDDNDVDGLVKLLLGEEQFARFEEHEVTMQDVAAVLEAYAAATGLGSGPGDGGLRSTQPV